MNTQGYIESPIYARKDICKPFNFVNQFCRPGHGIPSIYIVINTIIKYKVKLF